MEITRVEQRAYIKIDVLRLRNEMECHSEFVKSLGNNALPYHTVARWIGKFQQGRASSNDEQRSERPLSVRTDLARVVIEQRMDEDRRWTPLELERASGIEKRTINASSGQLYVYSVVILLHREGYIALISVQFIVHTCS
ncbi:HTH_48 domain-containing protein [Trichonephila clavata]|uniref:HTH_48 domain-containing protein n=1 Tax=Trichonephila clavata TaxID=2740835 RepID=A0A8X6KQ89_TRICU|nr:HTH_48 domain-containing protein [Trichonephila clavata]